MTDRDTAELLAESRLAERFVRPHERFPSPTDELVRRVCVQVVASPDRDEDELPEVTTRDIADALDVLHRARRLTTATLDAYELDLIEAARHAGMPEERLATLLGVDDEAAAQARYLRLRTDQPDRADRTFVVLDGDSPER